MAEVTAPGRSKAAIRRPLSSTTTGPHVEVLNRAGAVGDQRPGGGDGTSAATAKTHSLMGTVLSIAPVEG